MSSEMADLDIPDALLFFSLALGAGVFIWLIQTLPLYIMQ